MNFKFIYLILEGKDLGLIKLIRYLKNAVICAINIHMITRAINLTFLVEFGAFSIFVIFYGIFNG